MGRPPELRLPAPPRWPAWALATSIGLHGLAVVGLVRLFVPLGSEAPGRLLTPFLAPSAPRGMHIVALPPLPPAANQGHAPPPAVRHTGALPRPSGASRTSPGAGAPAARDTSAMVASTPTLVLPSYQSGQLWNPGGGPVDTVPRTHAELTDSAAKAIIRHYLDSLAALPGGGRVLPPRWKTTIGGREYGIDGQFITVAGFKIPTLLLGLLPLPVGGNEAEALDKVGQMRSEDYQRSLPRAQAAADQEEQRKAIRARKAAEQALTRKQREAP